MVLRRILSAFAFMVVAAQQQQNSTITTSKCPPGTYLSSTGCIIGCPPQTFAFDGICIQSCPNGTIVVNTSCIKEIPSPAPLSCDRILPGSSMDADTLECRCNSTSWIARNPAGVPPLAICESHLVDPTNNTNYLGTPPIHCGSFTRGLVFVHPLMDCQCDITAPYLIPNRNDRLFPFSCVTAITDIAPFQCNSTEYFSPFKGECEGRPHPPPLPPSFEPSSSADPTRRPSPLADPTRRPSLSMEPVPPPSADSTHSPSPERLPSESAEPIPLFSPTRVPAPRPTQIGSIAPARRSAAPTPRISRPTQRPAEVQNTLRLSGATLTAETDTNATIQTIQAALACSLRVAPEQIRIRNVTVTRVGGTIWNPPLPPPLSANGSIVCYNASVGTALAASFRRLSTAEAGVAVDYSMDGTNAPATSAELTTALVNSPMMIEVATSVGATGIAASTADSSIPPPSPNIPSDSPVVMIVSGVGAALAILTVSAAVILGVLVMRRPPSTLPTIASNSRTVIVMDPPPHTNMETTTIMNPMGEHDRLGFAPTFRTRV
jgi:hypothetical protein